MINLLSQVISEISSRVSYEVNRARKLVPTLVRFGKAEAVERAMEHYEALYQELSHRISHWRGTCEHPVRRRKSDKKAKRPRRATPNTKKKARS